MPKKTDWSTFKKDLPKNWIQEVQALLASEGMVLTLSQIRDIRYGGSADEEKEARVWIAIKKLKARHLNRKKRMQRLKALV